MSLAGPPPTDRPSWDQYPDQDAYQLAVGRWALEHWPTPDPEPAWDAAWGPDPATDPGYVPVSDAELAQLLEPARPRPRSASLDTRQKAYIGIEAVPASPITPDPDAALWRALSSAAERVAVKLDYGDVLAEIARRAGEVYDLERFRWFDGKAAAVRDCAKVRVVPHLGTGHGVAVPLSCHVRGEPDCERARVAKLIERHDQAALEAERPVFLTLTSRNVGQGDLAAGRRDQARAFAKLRRRAIFRGGPCRHRWGTRGPTGDLDGAPFHPCHEPIADPACHGPVCAAGCPKARGDRRAGHLVKCDRGCPTRTGLRQSHCRTHPPRVIHPGACPRACEHHGHKRGRNCPTFAHDPVRGGLASFDVTWSDAAEPWNLHLHMLLDAPWMAWAELRDLWQATTCTTAGCRHGRLEDGSPDPGCTGAWMVWIVRVADDPDQRRGAIREVLKYVAKPHGIVDSLEPDRVAEYLWATRHQRIVSGWGCWYRIQVDDDTPDDEYHVIQLILSSVRVPKVCPVCHVHTALEDWGNPFHAGRLEAARAGRHYGWHPPPAPEGRPATYAAPRPASFDTLWTGGTHA